VLELLSNAKKAIAAQPSGSAKRIQIQAVEDKDMIWFYVEDSGCGFDEHEKDKVFESFFSGQCFQYGAGMGLARAKAWVEHHGGAIKIESVARHAVVGFSLPKA
jgi:signal transduction histidine kinase